MSQVDTEKLQKKSLSTFLQSEMRAWLIWSLAGFFYLYQFVLRSSPGVMTDDLMRDFSVEACALGILTSFYLISYTALQIPVGLGMDKFGPSRLLRYAVPLCVFGTFIFAISESFFIACIGRLLIGAGATCAFIGSLKLATLWFHAEKLALVVGFTLLAGKIGASLGQKPLGHLIEWMGWRGALLYVIVPFGLLLTSMIWLFVKDTPPEGPLVKTDPKETTLKGLLIQLKDIIINYQIWALGFYGALMYAPILVFVELWGIPFLMKLYNIDNTTAGSITTMFFFGAGIGSPLVAHISDYFEDRKKTMAIGAILAIVCNCIIIYVPNIPMSAMYGLLFASGFVFSAQPLIFASVCQITPHSSNGTAISFTNMIVMMLGIVLQPQVGKFLEWAWSGEVLNGVPQYGIADYRFALISIPLCLIIALLLMPFIPETFPKSQKD